jgi:outer membrane receptor protein involved in Fe transport
MHAHTLVVALLSQLAAAPPSADNRTVISPSRIPASAFDSDRSQAWIGEEQIREDVAVDVPEVLAAIPGVTVQRTTLAAGAPILRGLIGPSNLLVIDGVRYGLSTNRTGPNQYMGLVDPSALARVGVLLGPSALLYGSDALGGVVEFETRDVPDHDGVEGFVQTRLSSADLGVEGAGELGGRSGPIGGRVGIGVRRHALLRTGGGEKVPLSETLQIDGRARGRLDLDGGWSLAAGWLASVAKDIGRIDGLGAGDARLNSTADHLAWLLLERATPSEGLGWRFQLGYHQLTEETDRARCRTTDGTVDDRDGCASFEPAQLRSQDYNWDQTRALIATASLHGRWLDDRIRLTAGLDGRHEWIGSRASRAAAEDDFLFKPRARGNFSDGSRYAGVDLFAWLEGRPYVAPGKVELVLTGGGRLAHVRARAPGVPGLGTIEYSDTGPAFGAGARLIIANTANVYFNWSQGFRSPNLQETTVLGDTGSNFEVPNDGLRAERSDALEVGVKLFGKAGQAQVAAFQNTLHDAVVREAATFDGQTEVDGKPVVRRTNADRVVYRGVEASGRTRNFKGFSLFGALAWIRGDAHPDGGESTPARRVPPLDARGGVRWEHPRFRTHIALVARGALTQDRLEPGDRSDLRICEDPARPGHVLEGDACEGTPGWFTLDLRAGISPVDALTVDLAVDNLLDTTYRLHGTSFDAPGIDARLLVRYAF